MHDYSWDDDDYMDYIDQQRLVEQDLQEAKRESQMRKRKEENYRQIEQEEYIDANEHGISGGTDGRDDKHEF